MSARLAILTLGILLVATGAGAQTAGDGTARGSFSMSRAHIRPGRSLRELHRRALRPVARRNDHVSDRDVRGRFHLDLRRHAARADQAQPELRPDVCRASVHDRQRQAERRRGVSAHHVLVGWRALVDGSRGVHRLRDRPLHLSPHVISGRATRSDDCERHLRAAQQDRPRGDCALWQRPCLRIRLLYPLEYGV